MGLATCRMLAAAKARAISIDDFQDANFEAIRKELQSINPSTEVQTVKVDVSSSASVTAWISGITLSFGHAGWRCQCGRYGAAYRCEEEPPDFE